MQAFNLGIYTRATSAVIAVCLAASTATAQPDAVETEVKRVNGHWRVVEMIEDGRAIPEDQMREWLPGGGVLEIVDYTILFKSPIDGHKSTKTYRLDPTTYPKRIAIQDRDQTTGTGIYKFDQGRLVVCVTNPAGQLPTEFGAHKGSGRTLLVLEKFEPGSGNVPGLNAKLPERQPIAVRSPPPEPAIQQITPPPTPKITPPPIVADSAAGRILTDAEVRNLTLGTWRMNDTEGSIDLVFDASGTFQTYRYYQKLQNFQYVFVPTPISTGRWSIVNGRLIANVTSSTRLDRVNQSFVPAVRSISATDMILVDHLGRVSRAVKLR